MNIRITFCPLYRYQPQSTGKINYNMLLGLTWAVTEAYFLLLVKRSGSRRCSPIEKRCRLQVVTARNPRWHAATPSQSLWRLGSVKEPSGFINNVGNIIRFTLLFYSFNLVFPGKNMIRWNARMIKYYLMCNLFLKKICIVANS